MEQEQTARSERLALKLVKGNRGEYQPISGEELLCHAAQAAHDVLRRGIGRVPITDPSRLEIEARVARLREPDETALPARG